MMKWKGRLKRGLAEFLAVAVVCSCVDMTAIPVFAREGVDGVQEGDLLAEDTISFTVPVLEEDLPDSEELFAGYMEKVLYEGLNDGITTFGNVGESRLQGEYNKKIYAALKTKIEEIAAGKITNTEFTLALSDMGLQSLTWTASQLGMTSLDGSENMKNEVCKKFNETVNSGEIMSYLLMDCPYELYWFDKTNGMDIGYAYSVSYASNSVTISELTFSFVVASEYQSGGQFTVDNSKIAMVSKAVQNAQKIVDKYEGQSDYEKLVGYRKEICDLVSYNHTAADNENTPYGNPWQLIWVFDGDDSTNVVCEGYSKAFQYLCDLSTFTDVTCYTVTGTMDAGRHMWNVVTIGNKNYLVDVTNCDTGSTGADDQLFLVGASGDLSKYTVTCKGNSAIAYTYDNDQKTLFGDEILTLSDSNYVPKTAITVTASQNGTITYGDSVADAHIQGSAITKDGNSTAVTGTFSWASDVKANGYGDAGTKTLNAIFEPEDIATYDSVVVAVDVTVDKKALTVKANAATKVYGGADPAFTYTAEGLINKNTLTGVLSRESGEDVRDGGYKILQGTLDNANYKITFQPGVLTITPADYQATVTAAQDMKMGVGEFTQPVFTGVNKEAVAGVLTYTYNQQTMNYEQLKAALSSLTTANAAVTVTYSFTATNSNYVNTAKTGTLTLTIKQTQTEPGESDNDNPGNTGDNDSTGGDNSNPGNTGDNGSTGGDNSNPGNTGDNGSTGGDNSNSGNTGDNNSTGGDNNSQNRPDNWNTTDKESSGAESGVLEGTGSTTDVITYGKRLLAANPTTFNTILLSWDAVSGAKSYEIFYSTSPDSGFKRLANVKKNFYKFSKAQCGVTYYFQMRVCQKGVKSEFGPVSYGRTDLTGATTLQIKKTTYNSVSLKWSKVAGAKKYEIFYADSMGGKWQSLGVKGGTGFTHKKLVTGATYYYQIRPVRDSFKGSWSNGVSTTTSLDNVSKLKVKAASADRMKLSWKKVKGATQYVILRADRIDGTYEVIGHSGKSSYMDTGLMGGTTYFYKVYAVSGPYRTKETEPVGQMTKNR